MPPQELRAFLLLLSLAVAGQGVRYLVTRPGQAPGGVQLLATLGAESPISQRDSAMRQGRPLAPGEQIDVDRATAGEVARLPKVGPRLAKTIVADRQAHGLFGSLGGLDRVAGIGPGLLKAIGPHVSFSGKAGEQGSGAVRPAAPLNINSASVSELDALPGIGPAKAQAIIRYREEHGPFTGVDGLAVVPGLSPNGLARLRDRVTAP
jgi:competence ComEA-like helix-hairpin-helix protein